MENYTSPKLSEQLEEQNEPLYLSQQEKYNLGTADSLYSLCLGSKVMVLKNHIESTKIAGSSPSK